jgi:hypothetical protein
MGKLHKEQAVTGRIFQALPTQTDIVALIYKMILTASNSGKVKILIFWFGGQNSCATFGHCEVPRFL